LLDREEVLKEWVDDNVKIHNLSKATWSEYLKGVQTFLEENKAKKLPLMVKALMETMEERAKEEYVRSQAFVGERKLNMQRRILYHSFRRCRAENRMKFLTYFRNNDHMLGDVLFIKSIHQSLLSNSKVLFYGKQSHAHTITQYLLHGEKYEVIFKIEHRSDNAPVELTDLAKALDTLKKKKKKRKKKKETKVENKETTEADTTSAD